MKIWIVWLPNVGKSTLFNALTNSYAADAANFPFCTIEPNIWIVDVLDQRVDDLARLSTSEKTIYATIKFVDIAWLVKWASQWEGMWNAFLANIKETDAIVQVLRHFQDNDIGHVDWSVDADRDAVTINTELQLADLDIVEKRLWALASKVKWKDKDACKEHDMLLKCREALLVGKMLYEIKDSFDTEEQILCKRWNLLTYKPMIYAINVSDTELSDYKALQEMYHNKLWCPVAIISAKLESDMIGLSWDEKQEFLQDVLWDLSKNQDVPTLDTLIALAFKTVWLMYYFTTWEKETRAWSVPVWSTAPIAAWAIHTDFIKWFIKAEVVSCDDFLATWSWSKARENGKLRLEWKEYIVKEWDVMLFKINR